MIDKQDDSREAPVFIDANRRGFLQGAAVAGGAAASGVAVAATDTEVVVDEQDQASNSKGYELTEHVKTYYKRARF